MAVVQRALESGVMALWCRDCPTGSVSRTITPKPVTFVYPFYENHGFFEKQIAGWHAYPESLKPFVSVMVVDDGSPKPARLPAEPPVRMQLFRVEQDVRWNWLAARNIGAHHAPEGWLLLTDMDHVVPAETLAAVVYGRHDPARVYAFRRVEWNGAEAAPHSASFLMTREMFWKIGGYDETLSGFYGTDGDYRRRLAKHATIVVLADKLIRYEHQGDASTSRYLRKQPEDARVRHLVAARRPGWRPKTLSFPYHEVA